MYNFTLIIASLFFFGCAQKVTVLPTQPSTVKEASLKKHPHTPTQKKVTPKQIKQIPLASTQKSQKTHTQTLKAPSIKKPITHRVIKASPKTTPTPPIEEEEEPLIQSPSVKETSQTLTTLTKITRKVVFTHAHLQTPANLLQRHFHPNETADYLDDPTKIKNEEKVFILTTMEHFLAFYKPAIFDHLNAKSVFWVLWYSNAHELQTWKALHQNSYKSASIALPVDAKPFNHTFSTLVEHLNVPQVSFGTLKEALCASQECVYETKGNLFLLF